MTRALHVETSVAAGPGTADRLWSTTQDPALHPRWDLRFSAIVPGGVDDDGRQEFTYSLALPHPRFALVTVTGTGTSTGERRSADGAGTSSISFVSHSALSPLARGSGYWRYAPADGCIRFVTGYDYRPGWGALGAAADPWLTRPLVGWATAWSFDRLRLWVEGDQSPERSRTLALAWAGAGASVVVAGLAVACRQGGPSRWAGLLLALAALGARPPARVPAARRCSGRPARPGHQTQRPSSARSAR